MIVQAEAVTFALTLCALGCTDSVCGGCTDGTILLTVRGHVTDSASSLPIASATVFINGASMTSTDAAGTYSKLLMDSSVRMAVVAPDHAKVIDQQLGFHSNVTHDFAVPSLGAFNGLTASLPGYDATLAIIQVTFAKTANCKSTDGATVALAPDQPGARVVYFNGGKVELGRMQAADSEKALIYNVDPSVKSNVELAWSASDSGADSGATPCTRQRYSAAAPTEPGVSYDESFDLEPGNALTRVVLVLY